MTLWLACLLASPQDQLYASYLDQLCKLFFLSSAVHQTVFCLMSTLPFSVGQVQDVGLIFLSAMATSIAAACLDAGRDAATALGTSLVAMCLATLFTGSMTALVGARRVCSAGGLWSTNALSSLTTEEPSVSCSFVPVQLVTAWRAWSSTCPCR